MPKKNKHVLNWILVINLLILFNSLQASAADLKFKEIYPKVLQVNFKGEITTGDHKKLIDIIDSFDGSIGLIELDSLGGDVSEAIKIANIVEKFQIMTKVTKDKTCASACFFIFIAGTDRLASGIELKSLPNNQAGFVGVHRPFLAQSGSKKYLASQQDAMRKVRDYLDYQLVSRKLTDAMLSRPSNDIYWLNSDDLEELGPYSPALEEQLISRCNYDRKQINQINEAKFNKNYALEEELSKKISKVNWCITELHSENYSNMKSVK